MNDIANECLETFPKWLDTLAEDAVALSSLLTAESIPEHTRRNIAGALGYLVKSLDLIPDGVEDLGYLDDAFVMRVAARLALEETPTAGEADIRGSLARLSNEAALIESLLESDYPRLVRYVESLQKGASRGRTVDEILTEPHVRSALIQEVKAWAKGFQTPSFTRDEKTIIKLRAFLSAKLP